MPITKSAKKALRQNKKRKQENSVFKRKMKDIIKKIEKALKEGKPEEAKKILPDAYKAIDKSAKKGIIKKNTASRKKSKLARMLKNASKS